jgi:hypothetical protein
MEGAGMMGCVLWVENTLQHVVRDENGKVVSAPGAAQKSA